MLEAAIPVLILSAIGLAHAAYYAAMRRTATQQLVAIEDFTRSGPAPVPGHSSSAAPLLELSRNDKFLPRSLAARLTSRAMEPLAGPDEPTVVEQDFVVEGERVFRRPLKVGGDLILRGRAVFEAAVVVNGSLYSEGDASFHEGALVKEDAVFSGPISLGTSTRKGWFVARTVRLEGEVRLNGRLRTSRGIYLSGAA